MSLQRFKVDVANAVINQVRKVLNMSMHSSLFAIIVSAYPTHNGCKQC